MEIEQAIRFLNHPLVKNSKEMHWADLGAGNGLFTNALAQLLEPGSKVLAVDKIRKVFTGTQSVEIEFVQEDFESADFNPVDLDGILMANSLHFVVRKESFLKRCEQYFKRDPCFLIVEYNLSSANPWVPFPIDFNALHRLFKSAGFSTVDKIYEAPSKFNRGTLYSLIAKK